MTSSSSLSIVPPTRDNYDLERPRTPYPFDAKLWRSVNRPTFDVLDKPAEPDTKRRKLQHEAHIVAPSMDSGLSLDTEQHRTNLRYNISPTELIAASKSIIEQVNWSEVVLDVVGRERPVFYRNAFEKILRLHVKELLSQGTPNDNGRTHCEGESERSLSSSKDVQRTCSDSGTAGSAIVERSSEGEEQDDDKDFVVTVSASSGSGEFEEDEDGDEDTEEEPDDDVDDDQTIQEDEDEDGSYEEDELQV